METNTDVKIEDTQPDDLDVEDVVTEQTIALDDDNIATTGDDDAATTGDTIDSLEETIGDEVDETNPEKDSNDETSDSSEENDNEEVRLNVLEEASLNNTNKAISNMASVLLDYNSNMSGNFITPQLTSRHYGLYNTIKSVLNRDDDETRTTMLTLTCSAFNLYKDEGFKNSKLFRFDTTWKWGRESLESVNIVMTIFSSLCDPETRKEALKTIDFSVVHEITDMTTDQISALELYFKP